METTPKKNGKCGEKKSTPSMASVECFCCTHGFKSECIPSSKVKDLILINSQKFY